MVIEWLARLKDAFEIHIYSQRVEDVDLAAMQWHCVSRIPGPHLCNYLWWFAANRRARRRNTRHSGVEYDLVYSPGVNCLDADAITVHIVFAEFVRRLRGELSFTNNRLVLWPRLLHRRLYYATIMFLERRAFQNPGTQIILTAPQTAAEMDRFFGLGQNFPVVSAGLDHAIFNVAARARLRSGAREALGLREGRFAVLLIGNDWRKKGLATLLDALRRLGQMPFDLLVVGRDDPRPFLHEIREKNLESRVKFLPPRKDVEFYYAAADIYAGPSLEDTFALPALEAMACGLPVIVSGRAGASALVTHNVDGLILDDPTDGQKLAALILALYEEPATRERLAQAATQTAQQYTWDRSAQELSAVFEEILRRKQK